MAAAMDHEMAGPEAQVRSEPVPDWARGVGLRWIAASGERGPGSPGGAAR